MGLGIGFMEVGEAALVVPGHLGVTAGSMPVDMHVMQQLVVTSMHIMVPSQS